MPLASAARNGEGSSDGCEAEPCIVDVMRRSSCLGWAFRPPRRTWGNPSGMRSSSDSSEPWKSSASISIASPALRALVKSLATSSSATKPNGSSNGSAIGRRLDPRRGADRAGVTLLIICWPGNRERYIHQPQDPTVTSGASRAGIVPWEAGKNLYLVTSPCRVRAGSANPSIWVDQILMPSASKLHHCGHFRVQVLPSSLSEITGLPRAS